MDVIHLVPGDTVKYFTSVNGTIGPWLYGTLTSNILFGVSLVQIYSYYLYSLRMDKWFEKASVFGLMIFLTGAVIAKCEALIVIFIDHYGDPNMLTNTHPLAYFPMLAFHDCINLICRIFFAKRAWSLADRSLPLAIALALAITANFAAGFTKVIILSSILTKPILTSSGFNTMMIVIDAYYMSGAVIDVVICIIICWPLLRAEKGFRSGTDSILYKILQYMLTTTIVTTAVAVTVAILTSQKQIAALAMCEVHPHIYAISVLFSLNTRHRLIAGASSAGSLTLSGLSSSGRDRRTSFPRIVNVGQVTQGSGIQVTFDRAELIELERDPSLAASSSNKTTFDEKSSKESGLAV